MLLKLRYVERLSNFAFKFKLRRYIKVCAAIGMCAAPADATASHAVLGADGGAWQIMHATSL
jgi:hypothetical protein